MEAQGTMPLHVDRMAAAKQLYSEGPGNRLCTKLEVGYGRQRSVRNGSKGFDLQDWKMESLSAEKKIVREADLGGREGSDQKSTFGQVNFEMLARYQK